MIDYFDLPWLFFFEVLIHIVKVIIITSLIFYNLLQQAF